ncbi:hypothetical protein RHS02_08140, partial [Rhizoctonia solani]
MDVASPSHLPHPNEPTPTLRVPTPHRRRKPSTPRNFLVFPVQLDQPRPSLEAFPFTTYSAFDLKARHMYDRNLARGLDDIWVDAANYYKQRQSSRHEFIIFSIASGATGMQNFVALDRNGYIQGSSGLGGSGKNKLGLPAQDYFHVSHYGDMKALANHCGRNTPKTQYTHVEHIGLATRALPFSQLLVLVNTISDWEPAYKSTTNDHWFAALIWECIIGIFASGIVRRKRFSEDRSRLKGLKVTVNQDEYQRVAKKYQDDLVIFNNGIEANTKKAEVPDDPDSGGDQISNDLVPPGEPNQRPKSPYLIITSINAPRAKITREGRIRQLERTRATSLHVNSKDSNAPSTIDPYLYKRLNKKLPSLPPDAVPDIPRSRAKSLNNSMRGQKRVDTRGDLPEFSNFHYDKNELRQAQRPPLPPQTTREFSWIKVESGECNGDGQSRRPRTAYSLPPAGNITRIPQGHLKQRTKST